MNHFTELELHRWAKMGPGDDAARLSEHLAECPECSSRYAQIIREQPLAAEPQSDAGEFVEAGYKAAKKPQRWVWPAAAAALLLILIGLPYLKDKPEDELHLRGANIQALSPAGVQRSTSFDFVWASGVAAAGYRIEIGRAERVIAMVDTKAPRLAAPPGLPPGDYWWQVSALDEAHRVLATSKRASFSLRP